MSKAQNTKKILVGICGHKNSGKDTVAMLLKQHFLTSYQCHRLAFADSLKDLVAQLTGGNLETINQNKNNPVLRYILQWVGQKAKEIDGDKILVDKVAEKYALLPAPCFVTITDVRFSFEADWIKEQGGFVIRVFRPLADTVIDDHPSELEVDKCKWDYGVRNDGSIRDLEREIKWVADFLKEKI